MTGLELAALMVRAVPPAGLAVAAALTVAGLAAACSAAVDIARVIVRALRPHAGQETR